MPRRGAASTNREAPAFDCGAHAYGYQFLPVFSPNQPHSSVTAIQHLPPYEPSPCFNQAAQPSDHHEAAVDHEQLTGDGVRLRTAHEDDNCAGITLRIPARAFSLDRNGPRCCCFQLREMLPEIPRRILIDPGDEDVDVDPVLGPRSRNATAQ